MILAQTTSDPDFLMSWFKPLLFALTVIGWGWIVSHLDKDAAYYYLHRKWVNLIQIGVATVAFGLMLLVPIFILGYVLGLMLLAAGIGGYIFYRNLKVPEEAKWTLSLDTFTRRIEQFQESQAQRGVTMALLDAQENRLETPTGTEPMAKAHQVLEDVMDFALARSAEQVDVAVDSHKAAISVSIDGVRYPQPEIEPAAALQLIDYVKDAAGLDVSDRRKKQTGTLRIDSTDHGRHRIDLETAGSTRGIVLSMHLDPVRHMRIAYDQLGLLDAQRQALQPVLEDHGRVVLVTAAPRQGTSTTLYSLLSRHDPYTSSVVALQDEIPYELEGVSHRQLAENATPQQANEQLATLLRSDPNVVMLSKIADVGMARQMAQAAEEVRFYAPIPGGDTFSALANWIKAVGDSQLAAEALGAIVAQRLVRKLCPTCRMPYKPDPAALRKLNLPPDRVTQLYNPSGQEVVKDKPRPCPDCQGLAYRGRIGVFEVMVLDPEARSYVAAGDLDRLRAHLRKHRMLWLQEAALARAVEGVTSIKEITRVMSGGKSSSSGTSRSSSGGSGGAPAKAAQS